MDSAQEKFDSVREILSKAHALQVRPFCCRVYVTKPGEADVKFSTAEEMTYCATIYLQQPSRADTLT